MANSFIKSIDLAVRTLLYTKFGSILGIDTYSSEDDENINRGVVFVPKEIAEKVVADKRGSTFLEFINFYRKGPSPAWKRNRSVVARRGIDAGSKTVKSVAVDLNYDIWFWSNDLNKIDLCCETYLFWQYTNPKLTIVYNTDYTLTFDLHFGEIIDESTIPEKYTQGIKYIYMMPLKVDGQIFQSSEFGVIEKIQVRLWDADDLDNYTDVVVEDSDYDSELASLLQLSEARIYGITAVDLVANTITIANDQTSELNIGDYVDIEDSTANDRTYTIANVALSGDDTIITLTESLSDDTVDGVVIKREKI